MDGAAGLVRSGRGDTAKNGKVRQNHWEMDGVKRRGRMRSGRCRWKI